MSDVPDVFTLPDLGEGLTEAEIVRWLVAVGDTVAVDQPVVEVETAKAIVEVPSPYAGWSRPCTAPRGRRVDVGRPLITVAGSATPIGAGAAEAIARRRGPGPATSSSGTARQRRAPVARRRRAPERTGTPAPHSTAAPPVRAPARSRASRGGLAAGAAAGARRTAWTCAASTAAAPGARSPASDVEAAQRAPPARPGRGRHAAPCERARACRGARVPASAWPMGGFRKAVAAALTRAARDPRGHRLGRRRRHRRCGACAELRDARPTPGPGLLALRRPVRGGGPARYPELNARVDIEREEIVQLDGINLGIAVQTDRGLVVPAVPDAQPLTTRAARRRDPPPHRRGARGPGDAEELTAGTFTLNNYGSFGVDGSAAIINHPQVAILGLGRIIDRPWVVDGDITVRKIAQMSLVFDHRVCDGGTAAGFMRLVADAIESPASAIAHL